MKMTDLGGTYATYSTLLPNFMFTGGTVCHIFCDCYDITLLTRGEGPHLLVTVR